MTRHNKLLYFVRDLTKLRVRKQDKLDDLAEFTKTLKNRRLELYAISTPEESLDVLFGSEPKDNLKILDYANFSKEFDPGKVYLIFKESRLFSKFRNITVTTIRPGEPVSYLSDASLLGLNPSGYPLKVR